MINFFYFRLYYINGILETFLGLLETKLVSFKETLLNTA